MESIILIILIMFLIIYGFFSKCYETFDNSELNLIDYYVIHIKSYTSRLNNILENKKKLGYPINIFDGVIGKEVDINNLELFDPNINFNFKYTYINEIGCYLSHLMLIKSILNKNTGYTVVFEDDFIIIDDNLNKSITDIINKMPNDFDIIVLGNLNNNHDENLIDNIYFIDKKEYLWGTHAYLINNKNAQKIYNKLLNITQAIDNKYKQLFDDKELIGLTIYPILVDQQRVTYPSTIR